MNGPYLLQFDYLFHNPNPAIDEYLHGDHTHTDEDGNEVVSPGTPDRPVVIDPDPDPDPDADPPNANPGPAPDAAPQQAGDGMIEPLTNAKLDALTKPGGVPTGGVFRGGAADEFIFDGVNNYDPPASGASLSVPAGELTHAYGTGANDQFYGGDGNDVLVGGYGNDILEGGPGNDYLFGSLLLVYNDRPPTSVLDAEANILMGGPGHDHLESGGASDIMSGGAGNDHLVFYGVSVAMVGGPGRDVFDVTLTRNGGQVKIMDFQDGVDKIKLAGSTMQQVFGGIGGATTTAYGHKALYQLATHAGVQWDMGWIATEVDNGVTLPVVNNSAVLEEYQLTIEGAYLANLQFELVNDDLFIV